MVQQQVETSKGFGIMYDRSERCYTVTRDNGDVVNTFPAKQKGEALRFAIGLFHPELAALVEEMAAQNPQLERVAWAGASLITEGAAINTLDVPVNGVIAQVDSSDGMGRYALMQRPADGQMGETITCNCEHYVGGSAPTHPGSDGSEHRVCKHIAAYRMVQTLRSGVAQ